LIFFSLGLPGRLTEWCDAVIARLACGLGGKAAVASWPPLNTMLGYHALVPALDQVALSLVQTSATHLVMGIRQPDERLRAALVAMNIPFTVALADPRLAFDDIFGPANGDVRAVTRAIANSCPLVMRCATSPGAMALPPAHAVIDADATVAAIACHFNFSLDEGQTRRVVEELATRGLNYPPQAPLRPPEARHKMVEGALAGYAECFSGGDLAQIIWTRELFIANGDSGKGLTEPIEVRGGARILIFGPYIHVPAGSWSARMVLGFSPEAAGYTFIVDAYSGGQLGLKSFQPGRAGIYSVDIDFSLDEPSGQGLEIRLWVWSEAAQGEVAFGHVILRPIAMRQPDALTGSADDYTKVLGL
jgi:hypothetical protein